MSEKGKPANKSHQNKATQKPPPVTQDQTTQAEVDPLELKVFIEGSVEGQVSTLQKLPLVQRQAMIEHIGRLQGNQQVTRVVDLLQRHPGHEHGKSGSPTGSQEEQLEQMTSRVMRYPAMTRVEPVIMRATLLPDTTELVRVNVNTLPLRESAGAGAASLGDLVRGNRLRVLERSGGNGRVHVENGDLRGQTGWVEMASSTAIAEPTSQRTPGPGLRMPTLNWWRRSARPGLTGLPSWISSNIV